MTDKHERPQTLNGTVVLITGASRGLGAALAREFARAGAALALASRAASADELARVRREAEALGAAVLTISADVAQRDDVERLAAEALSRFGRVDILINNASALGPTPLPLLLDTPPDAFRDVLETNVLGPFLLTRALAGQMLARNSGLVINVSSDAGAVGYAHWGAYGASKAALDQITRVWAAELDGSGVGIVSVDPGSMDTRMHREAVPDEDPAAWADPARVAPFFLQIATTDPRLINGRRFEAQEPKSLAALHNLVAAHKEPSHA